jgi:hypothetical protein
MRSSKSRCRSTSLGRDGKQAESADVSSGHYHTGTDDNGGFAQSRRGDACGQKVDGRVLEAILNVLETEFEILLVNARRVAHICAGYTSQAVNRCQRNNWRCAFSRAFREVAPSNRRLPTQACSWLEWGRSTAGQSLPGGWPTLGDRGCPTLALFARVGLQGPMGFLPCRPTHSRSLRMSGHLLVWGTKLRSRALRDLQ